MRDSVVDAGDVSLQGLEGLIVRMKDAAFVLEVATGRIRIWNPAAARIFGYSVAEALGQSVYLLLGVAQEGIMGAIASDHPIELRATRQDGSCIALELTLSPLETDGLALAILRDATDRRCAELARERVLSMISHELRTPISTVMGFGSLISDGLAGPINDQQRHYLSRLLIAADDLHALVNDLLEIGQLHSERFSLNLRPFRLSEAVAEAIEGLAPQAEAKRLIFDNQVPDDFLAIRADGKRIAQVLRNLLSNAIKFSPEAGTIRIRARLDGEHLRCEITDMGPGIPREEQGRIFQPFVRLAAESVPGTGLGLNIAKSLVEAHHGRIGLRSEIGQGATFWFKLPAG